MPTPSTGRSGPLRIAVFGGGRCGTEVERCAVEVGRRIAEAGAVLLCGGGPGVMAAAAEGARGAGGRVVGILPGADRRRSPPNRFIELPIFTGLGQGRNLVLVLSSQAAIAIGGEWGTLSEIALAQKHGRPVVLLDSWSLEPPPPDSPTGAQTDLPVSVATPAEAVETAIALARRKASAE